MKILAAEQSTALQGAALLDGDRLLAAEQWEASGLRSQQLFVALPRLLRAAGVDAADIEAFAVGLGPGSFSGVRSAVAAMRAMALPGRRPVVGVPSAEAVALSLMPRHPEAGEFAVLGDARRRTLWLAVYAAQDGMPVLRGEIGLIGLDELPAVMSRAGRMVGTPDWDRLADALLAAETPGSRLVHGASMPTAVEVARLAAARLAAGNRIGIPLPIYLHPAVAAAKPVRTS